MEVVSLFKTLLSSQSVTPDDGGIFAIVEQMFSDFTLLRVDRNGVKNLFAYKKFGTGDHLCFAGHVDVVPAGTGWDSNPFVPLEKEGIIYARGAQDMKSGLAAFMQAVRDTKHFKGTLSLLLTSDEEGLAVDGTLAVLEVLKEKNMLPDFALVAEPTCEKIMGDALKIGRRGSINATLTILGKQGHAAYPHMVTNPVNLLAPRLEKLAGHLMDDGDDFFEPSQMVITDIRGGMQVTNVTPSEVRIMLNVRNNTRTDVASIKSYIETLFGQVPYTLEIAQSSRSFVTDKSSKIVTSLVAAVEKECGISPKLSTAGGTSDARYLAEFGVNVVEFGVKNDKIHKVNESTSVDEVRKLYQTFVTLIEAF